jgi:hypothetical protein
LDALEALWTWPEFAPETGMVFGHASKPASHSFFRTDPAVGLIQLKDPLRDKNEDAKDDERSMLIELRSYKKNGGVGLQTLVPPSIHSPSGERYEFVRGLNGEPANIDADQLVVAVYRTAACALLGRYAPAPKGGRHDFFLALSGALAHARWKIEDAECVVRAVYRVLWQANADPALAAKEVETSFQRHAAGEQVTGLPHLKQMLKTDVFKTVVEWLGLGRAEGPLRDAEIPPEYRYTPGDTNGHAPEVGPPPTDPEVPPERGRWQSNARSAKPPTQEEEKPEEAELSVLPAFPEDAWRGPFQDYRTAMKGTTEACDEAHFATFWSVSGAILGRRVSMGSGDVIYCNTYIVVHGLSGDKKTTAERRVIRCRLLEDHPMVKFIAGVGSAEGLAEKLDGGGSALFFWEEFASMLSRARWTGSTLLEFITECFDCPDEWHNHYRKDPIHLEEPTPSILTATTPEWFWKHAKAEDFFGGFGNRFIAFAGPKKPALPDPAEVNGEIIHRIKGQLKVMAERPPRRAGWTEGAAKLWREFYVRFENQERPGLLGAALKRVHIYVRKLAMTYAALEDTLPYVHLDQLKAAIAVVEYCALCMERLLDTQAAISKPLGGLERIFLKRLGSHEGRRLRYWQQTMSKHCGDSETFNKMVRNLVQADRIEIRMDERKKRVYLSNS